MKKYCSYIGFILLFLIGLSILLYPTISNMWNEYRSERLIAEYDDNLVVDESGKEAMFNKVKEYNKSLVGSTVPDVFAVREDEEDEEYESLLNPSGNSIMGIGDIAKIGVNIPIYHYATEEVLKVGVGHLFGSSLPIGGDSTHAVLTAHSGLPSAKLFTDLEKLNKKDMFYIKIYGDTLAYEVDQILVVKPDETESLVIYEGKDYVTLFTCTPYAVNTHRLLVRGHRVDYEESVYIEQKEELTVVSVKLWIKVLCGVFGFICAILIVRLSSRKEKSL